MSMILLRDVSAAWGWDSSNSPTKEITVDEVHINEEIKVNDDDFATTLSAEELASEIPVSIDIQTSMNLRINRVKRETQAEEKRVLDTLRPSRRPSPPNRDVMEKSDSTEEKEPENIRSILNDVAATATADATADDIDNEKFDRDVMAKFINTSSKSVYINFINQETKEEQRVASNVEPIVGEIDEDADYKTPQQGVVITHSYPGHVFAIFDEDRSFRTLLTVDPGHTHDDKVVFTITDFETDPLACKAHFINSLTTKDSVVSVNWVNPENGEETTVIDKISPNQASYILTRKGHTFRAYDEQHTFRTEFVIHNGNGNQQFLHITGVNGSASADQSLAKFINVSPTVVHINYIDEETHEEQLVIENLRPNEDQVLETHSGHQFVAYDEERTFRKVYTMNMDMGMTESHHIHHEEL